MLKKSILLYILLAISVLISAQTKTWDGGSTSNDYWHTDCNWNPDGVPACTDIVTIPTGNNVIILTGIIAHCEVLNLAGTATLDIQGTGKLEISSINTCVGTKSTASVGCSLPSTSWSVNGTGLLYKPGGYPCTPVGADSHMRTLTNDTGYDITVTIPPISCSNKSAGSVFTILAGASYNLTISQSGCCINGGDGTIVATWTATDGGSGSFNINIVTTN